MKDFEKCYKIAGHVTLIQSPMSYCSRRAQVRLQLSGLLASSINAAVEGSIQLSALGTGTLVALQKPNKPRGPLISLRLVVLLNGIRNILSLILLKRFSPYAESYIPASQAGFCKGQSCTDIIFTKWLLCSTAIMYGDKLMCIAFVWTLVKSLTHQL